MTKSYFGIPTCMRLGALAWVAVACMHGPQSGPAARASVSTQLPAAEARLRTLIDVINSGDSASIAAFAESAYATGYLGSSGGAIRAVRRWLEINQTHGRIAIDSLISSDARVARAWARSTATRAWLDFRVEVDTVGASRITRIGLGRGIKPEHARLRDQPLHGNEVANHLSAYMDELARDDFFSGTVLVAKDSTVVFQGAYGFADRERRIPNRMSTRFDLASVGKLFTAVAVAQLAEQRLLAFTDTIARFGLPIPRQIARVVTVSQLLEHRSGLGELGAALDSAMRRARTVAEMARLFTDTSLSFTPGTDVQYSNRGYIVLGALIEAVAREDYFRYVQTRIFAPAEMRSSGFFADDDEGPDRAVRYSRYPTLRSPFIPGQRLVTEARHDVRGGPAGGAYATAEDLFRFVLALESGKLVSVAMRGTVPNGHRGGAPGATSYLFTFPGSGYTIIVLSNYDSIAPIVGDYIAERVDR